MRNLLKKKPSYNARLNEITPHLARTRLILVVAILIAFVQVNFLKIDDLTANQYVINLLLLLSLIYQIFHTTLFQRHVSNLGNFIISILIHNTLLTLITIYSDGILVYLTLIYFIGYLVVLNSREILSLTLIQIFYINLLNYFQLTNSLSLRDLVTINSIFIFLGLSSANLVTEFTEKSKSLLQMREVNNLKNTFISIISHNLRTPITAINGYLNLLNKQIAPSKKQSKKDIQNALYNTENLSELVDDIIELTKIESGRAIFDIEKVDVVALTKKVVEVHFEKLAELKKLDLVFEAKDLSIKEAFIDEKRTAIAISNVIDNAIKFTERGQVTVKVFQEGGFVILKVMDTGPGITNPNILKIFNQFNTFGEFFSHESSGLGLGLYTTKLIIENQRGLVEIQTFPGHGTNFTIKLPTSPKLLYG